MDALIVFNAVACAVMGGVFFAFSTFVMQALGALPPARGVHAMQSINVFAPTPIFMGALFGTAVACLALTGYVAVAGAGPETMPIVAGSAIYVIGTIVVTIVCNVPLNNALAAVDPDAPDAVWVWTRYQRRWVAWNHVRTVSGIAAAALFAYALTLPRA